MGPKSQSHPTGQSLFSFFLLFFFFFSLSSPLFFLSLFFFICSSSEQKAHTHRPLTCMTFFLLSSDSTFFLFFLFCSYPTGHSHADPSREVIGVNLRSHIEKLHHALVLLIATIVLVLRSCQSVEIGIHSNYKVVIYKYIFCWLLFRAKFDCNFIQSVVPCTCCGNLL